MKKKRPIILLELLVAIAILALSFIPIAGAPFLYLKKQKEKLLELELERESEVIFYELLKDFREHHPGWNFSGTSKVKHELLPRTVALEGWDNIEIYPHYHLYYYKNGGIGDDENCYHLRCNICLSPHEKGKCHFKRKNAKTERSFSVVVKKEKKHNS